MIIRAFLKTDYPGAFRLWKRTDGLGLNESDTEEAIDLFLERNPGCSAVAVDDDEGLVGAVLCGHDGRRGYLHHLAVEARFRGRGLGTRLVDYCLARLLESSIAKCNIFVYRENEAGNQFWRRAGWNEVSWMTMQKRLVPSKGEC